MRGVGLKNYPYTLENTSIRLYLGFVNQRDQETKVKRKNISVRIVRLQTTNNDTTKSQFGSTNVEAKGVGLVKRRDRGKWTTGGPLQSTVSNLQ